MKSLQFIHNSSRNILLFINHPQLVTFIDFYHHLHHFMFTNFLLRLLYRKNFKSCSEFEDSTASLFLTKSFSKSSLCLSGFEKRLKRSMKYQSYCAMRLLYVPQDTLVDYFPPGELLYLSSALNLALRFFFQKTNNPQ